MSHLRPVLSPLGALVGAVAAAVPQGPRAVAAAMAPHLTDPMLLAGLSLPCCAERYVRHLLHEAPDGSWALAALVWRPGQMSPVHAHRAWCAFGIARGVLAETRYARAAAAEEAPVLEGLRLCRPGDVAGGPADPRLIHRLANLSCGTAVSLHAYGLPYARFCTDLNTVHAA